jgi:hypothetical protein
MGLSHLPSLGLFRLKIGLHPPVEGTIEAVKGINALHRLDHTGPAPYALIVSDTINIRISRFVRRSFGHDKPPCSES